MKLNMICIKLH